MIVHGVVMAAGNSWDVHVIYYCNNNYTVGIKKVTSDLLEYYCVDKHSIQ